MEDSELLRKRREKIDALKADGVDLYPNDVRVDHTTGEIQDRFGHLDEAALQDVPETVSLAGRIMAIRNFGKAAFAVLQDRKGRLQVYIARNILGDAPYTLFKRLDIGDIVFVAGRVFRTRTGELTVEAHALRLIAKSLHPLPEKWHGLTDVEIRYRQRHLDLIVNPKVRDVFYRRSRIIQLIRRFMEDRDFLEVETPMMQPKAGGAVARPFKTFHNALGMDFYLRIAPELYLKRLITGGLERVFEINRNFRNEGMSSFHNPEFTMMEFYQAYATFLDLMTLTEDLFTHIARDLFGGLTFTYQGTDIDLTPPWTRLTVQEAILQYTELPPEVLRDPARAVAQARARGLDVKDDDPLGKVIMAIFEETVETRLVQPHFITHYPVEVSPLSRRSVDNPGLTDRFELYICGREIANAFSELNDPADQRERFLMQAKDRDAGDDEAHVMDEDYVRVLEYGMPPTAGEGIGIDRLVMLFTDATSIRDVILFPHMRIKEDA
ncbi:MAG TPA: lysine--tRNA ligase [Syntrophales bacterium]|nr:lysine--tRNA ligase [Syntrophales bacterium]HOS76508.1 lysine--tRNA ligase [Syntrophales bacterium]HPB69328.1 lysine--tRNA ligase [Syntrophales bacterium]HQN25454.1 lysine--tRNA ligase [Syntrophales bacterium]HQP29445.1 lysine--tRNA ligase [Syntrophales bacterium]